MAYKIVDKQAIADLRNSNPGWTLQQIGDEKGISKERVRQILAQLGLPTKAVITYMYTCPNCGGRRENKYSAYCPPCRLILKPRWTTVTCTGCGIEFERRTFINKRNIRVHTGKGNTIFHNRQCMGKHLAKHHGFGVHPENIISGLEARRGKKKR